MSTAQLLPLAIPMMAGPQILSAIIFVTTDNPVKVSAAYVAAIAVAVTVATAVWYGLAGVLGDAVNIGGSAGETTAGKVIETALIGLLLVASIKAYLGRETSEPPKWLGKLQGASPARAFQIGLLLIFLMPSDFVITMTTGLHLQSHGLPYWSALALVGATVFVAALPLLGYLLFRKRAMVAMPKARDWMNTHSWAVNIFVYGVFIVLILA